MQPFLGEIRLFSYKRVPSGWAACDGTLLPISQNEALFHLIGSSFGGDGRSTFALPDLRNNMPFSPGQGGIYCIAVLGVLPKQS